MQTEHFKVAGMTCGGCTTKVTQALKTAPGVSDVNVSLSTGEAKVLYDERLTSLDQLKATVERAGYSAGLVAAHSEKSKRGCCS